MATVYIPSGELRVQSVWQREKDEKTNRTIGS